jgi:predicted aspartyl protease
MKLVPVAAIAAFVVAGSHAAPPSPALQTSTNAPVSIPFELASRHIIVKVSVNKSRPLSFVLDTGASAAIVRMDVAKELGLSLYGSANTGGAGAGRQAGQQVKNATWSLVGLDSFADTVKLALPLPVLPVALGRDVDGIIGGEFIRRFVLELDYQARSMTVHNRETFAYNGRGETLPLDFNPDGHPVLQATVTTLDGQAFDRRFMLDTGSGMALILHSPFVAQQNLPGPQSKTIRAIGGAGAGGRTVGRLGRVAALQIGSFRIDNPITMFSEDKAGAFANASLAGNIGAQITSKFRLFLDYGRRRIILEPSPTFAEPFDRAFSGIAVRAEGANYRSFRVVEVLEESPATDAGIVEGDIITAIDGTLTADLTLTAIHDMFEKPAAYELTIRRREQTIKTTLRPRRLI